MKWKVILLVGLLVFSLTIPIASGEHWYDQKNDYVKLKTYPTYDNKSGFNREFEWEAETDIVENVTSGENLEVPDKWKVSSDMELYMEMESVQAKSGNASIDKSISLNTGASHTEDFDGERNVTGYINLTSTDDNIYDYFMMDSGFPENTSSSNNVTVNENNITANGPEASWISTFFNKTVDSHQLRREVDEIFSYENGATVYIRENTSDTWTPLTGSAGVYKRFQLLVDLSYSEYSANEIWTSGADFRNYDSSGSVAWNNLSLSSGSVTYSPTEDVVFVGSDTGDVYAFDASNGDYIDSVTTISGAEIPSMDISGKRVLSGSLYTRTIVSAVNDWDSSQGYMYHLKYKYSSGSPKAGSLVISRSSSDSMDMLYTIALGYEQSTGNYAYWYSDSYDYVRKRALDDDTILVDLQYMEYRKIWVRPNVQTGGAFIVRQTQTGGVQDDVDLAKVDNSGTVQWETLDVVWDDDGYAFTIDKDYIYYPDSNNNTIKIYKQSDGSHVRNISVSVGVHRDDRLAVDGRGYLYLNKEYGNTVCLNIDDGSQVWEGLKSDGKYPQVIHSQGRVWNTDTMGSYNPNYVDDGTGSVAGKLSMLKITWKDTVDFEVDGELFTAKTAGFSHAVDKTNVGQIQIYNHYGLNSFKEDLEVEYPLLKGGEVSPLPITVTVKGDNGTLAEKTFNVEYGEPLEGVIEDVNYTKVRNISTSVDISGYSAEKTIVDFSNDTMEFMFKVEFYYETVSSGYFNFIDTPTFWAVFIALVLTIAVGVKTKNADVSAFAFTSLIGIMFVLGFVHAFVLYVTLFSFGLLYVIKVRRKDW